MSHKLVYEIDGLKVRNLTKQIKLVISEQDCKRGNTKTPNSGAAALAAVRQVPNCSEARIHIGRIYLRVKADNSRAEYWLRGKTPNALRTEIATFDRGGSFEPGVYSINPLSPSERPDGRSSGGKPKLGRGRKGKHRTPGHTLRLLKNIRGSAHSEYRAK